MRTPSIWLVLALGSALVGCGGRIGEIEPDTGLGDGGMDTGADGGSSDGGSSDGGSSDSGRCSSLDACSASPPPPPVSCPAGFTAKLTCSESASGSCGWTMRCEGKVCGTPDSVCDAGDFCKFDGCPAPGSAGHCAPKPFDCPSLYAPVCGCDGRTYSNACIADAEGVPYRPGGCVEPGRACGTRGTGPCAADEFCSACSSPTDSGGICLKRPTTCSTTLDPVCACDGKTYDNECVAQSKGLAVVSRGKCGSSSGCTSDVMCGKGAYCNYGTGSCGGPGTVGTCTKKGSGTCPDIWAPVCGCDGKTYGNTCEATTAGANIIAIGECFDGPPPRGCGGIAGLTCPVTDYCDFGGPSALDPCGGGDSMGTCRTRPSACSKEIAPVCGCDGKTYENVCLAYRNGSDARLKGGCPK